MPLMDAAAVAASGRGLDAAEVGGGANFMLRGLNNLDRLIGYVIINYEKNTRFSAILNFT